MARNKIGLQREISEILNGVQIREKAGVFRVCVSPPPSQADYVRQKQQAKDTQIPPIKEPGRDSSSHGEAIGSEQSKFAAIVKVLKQIPRNIFSSRARKQKRRLRSIRKNLLINLES